MFQDFENSVKQLLPNWLFIQDQTQKHRSVAIPIGAESAKCSADTRQTAHRGEKGRVQNKISYLNMFSITSREISSHMNACNLTFQVIHMASLDFVFVSNENITKI